MSFDAFNTNIPFDGRFLNLTVPGGPVIASNAPAPSGPGGFRPPFAGGNLPGQGMTRHNKIEADWDTMRHRLIGWLLGFAIILVSFWILTNSKKDRPTTRVASWSTIWPWEAAWSRRRKSGQGSWKWCRRIEDCLRMHYKRGSTKKTILLRWQTCW